MAEAYSLSFHTVAGAQNTGTQMETGYQLQKTIMIVSIPICTLGLLGNAVVVWLLWCFIPKTNFTVYFLNKAVADLAVLIYYITVFILFVKEVPMNLFSLHIMELAHGFGFNASTYILTAISAERFLMAFSPTWYKLNRPTHLSEIMCALLWSLSCLVTVTLYFACYLQLDPLLTEVNSICEPTKMARAIVNLLVFLPIMVLSTLLLLVRMLNTPQGSAPEKIDITIVATVLLFLLFAASVRIIDIIVHWVPQIHISVVFLIFHFLDAIDSSGNPFIYFCVGYTKNQVDSGSPTQTFLQRAFLDDENRSRNASYAPRRR
ncbi:mas-related G-protein coupled receptor member H [Anolis carolinensis]|uniref:mas-related G-protein coupled receptor member H n=1 Tax=Anolis carolinensis TaxID=28377 RepID=UPI002F2B7675